MKVTVEMMMAAASATGHTIHPEDLRKALEAALSASPAGVVKDIDGGRFEEWTLADFAAQCRMQSREQLDPDFSRFMAALSNRLSKPSGINVKPLRFEEAKAGIWTSGLVIGGEYRIMLTAGKGFQVSRGMIAIPDNQTWFPLMEIAEAAAFADYSARIMSAIEPAGVKPLEAEEYRKVMDAAIAAYEANTPPTYRYSATALCKAVEAAFAARILTAIEPAGVGVETPPPSSHVAGSNLMERLDSTITRNVTLDVAAMSPQMRQRYRAALATTEGKDNG